MSKKIVMKKHYVTFFSPGTFFSEHTTKEIDKWDVKKAMKMADNIVERYSATPYGFRFTTRGRTADDFDSKELARSNMYYLGGRIETLEEVEARNDPKEEILRSNMRCNKWDKIIVNENSWRMVQPFEEEKGDVLLEYTPPKQEEDCERKLLDK